MRTGQVTIKIVFSFLFFLFSVFLLQSCAALPNSTIDGVREIESTLSSNFFTSCQAAVSIYDLTSAKSLFTRNDRLLFHPASNQKILTTAAAYFFLGPAYNFETTVFRSGELKDSVFKGDYYFTGGFDPLFSSNDLDLAVSLIKKSGIKKIEGNIYADFSAMDSLSWGEGWMWDDEAAYFSPLTINDNAVRVIVSPGEPGLPANVKLLPQTSFARVSNRTETIAQGTLSLVYSRDWLNQQNIFNITGRVPLSERADTLTIRIFNPRSYFLTLLKESFGIHGILLTGRTDTLNEATNAGKCFAIFHNIEPAIRRTNKQSDNLCAELILRALALEKYGKPASAKNGISLIDSLILKTGLDPHNYRLVDGSGLSFYNLVSTELLIEIFKYLYFNRPVLFGKLFDTFPISGIDGTLIGRMTKSAAFKQVHAKTGTLTGVSALSGLVNSKNNHRIIFSILMQNFPGDQQEARRIQDRLCEIIYQNN